MLTDLTIYYNYSFFSLVLIQFILKCNNNTINGCHLAQHEELVKPLQVLLGESPTVTVLPSTSPHVGLKATINCILLCSFQVHIQLMCLYKSFWFNLQEMFCTSHVLKVL